MISVMSKHRFSIVGCLTYVVHAKIITIAVVMVMWLMQSLHWLLIIINTLKVNTIYIIIIHDHHLPDFKQLGF